MIPILRPSQPFHAFHCQLFKQHFTFTSVFGLHLELMLKAYTWLLNWKTPGRLSGIYGMLGIKPSSATCKASTPPIVLSLQPHFYRSSCCLVWGHTQWWSEITSVCLRESFGMNVCKANALLTLPSALAPLLYLSSEENMMAVMPSRVKFVSLSSFFFSLLLNRIFFNAESKMVPWRLHCLTEL